MGENFMILPWSGYIAARYDAVDSGNQNLFEVQFWDDSLTHPFNHKIITSSDIWFSVDVLAPGTNLSSIPLNPSDIKSVDSNNMSSSQDFSSPLRSHQEREFVPILQSFIDDFSTVAENEEDPQLASSLFNNEAKE